MDDDDWLEDDAGPSKQGGARDPLVDTEWNRLATKYSDAGYREGITDGKLSTLQQGFDQGFNLAVTSSRRLGRLRGRANGLLTHLTRLDQASTKSTKSSTASATRSGDSGPVFERMTDGEREQAISQVRGFVRRLGAVRRDDILPVDLEREQHEKEEHPDGEEFELDKTDKRDMEGLEMAMEGVKTVHAASSAKGVNGHNQVGGHAEQKAKGKLREGALLDALEKELVALEDIIRLPSSATD